jgi:hypothetical protein
VLADVRFQDVGSLCIQLDESDPRKLKVIKEFNKRLLEAKRKNADASL